MLLIPCPWCGPRNQVEFTYGGDATLRARRPMRRSPRGSTTSTCATTRAGRTTSCGMHGAGCRSWFKVRRDTRTHDIVASARVDQR